ncbi:unnamed protein product [Rotaria sp. Silwood2]|nr:unnamed protein product [Rotaria sp. Silwood2]
MDNNNSNNDNEQIRSLICELELMRERYGKLNLEQDLIDVKQKIIHLQDTIDDVKIENQRYKDDCNLAVRLLQRHPNEFISTTTLEHIQEQSKTNRVIIPTFPPIFVTPLPLHNTTSSPSPVVTSTITDDFHLAESLFKLNTVHRYPSSHFICSNCHRTIKYCDIYRAILVQQFKLCNSLVSQRFLDPENHMLNYSELALQYVPMFIRSTNNIYQILEHLSDFDRFFFSFILFLMLLFVSSKVVCI